MIHKIKNYVNNKVDKYEIYYEDTESLNCEADINKLKFISSGKISGFGIQVAIGKRIGFSSTTNLNNYKECVDKAIKIAKLNNPDRNFKDFAKPSKYKKAIPFTKKLLNFNSEDFYKLFKDYNSILNEFNAKFVNLCYTKDINNITILNSNNIEQSQKLALNEVGYEIVLEGSSIENGSSSTDILKDEHIHEAIERLKLMKKKASINGEMQLLMYPTNIIDFLQHTFEFSINSENVQKKKSIFTGKLNSLVADKKLTIIDNGTEKGLVNTRSFDDEGIPTQKTPVIQNGVLKNFFYNTYTANKENKKSTGNAIRSINSVPRISSTNLIIQPGTKSKEQLISSIDKGILVKSILGSHTMNEQTGNFSLGVTEGQYIEKGEIKHSVKDTMVSGNFYDLIKKIESIGKELKHYSGGYYMPSILFPKIKVIS